jgi:hypothetical protein
MYMFLAIMEARFYLRELHCVVGGLGQAASV